MPSTTAKGVPYSVGLDPVSTIDTTMQSLAQWVDDNPGIRVVTTAQRDAITGVGLWDGRFVWNVTTASLERWSAGTTKWVSVLSLARTWPEERTFTIQGDVKVDNAARDYLVPPFWVPVRNGLSVKSIEVVHQLQVGGTVTFDIRRNATVLATATATTTEQSTSLGNVQLAHRDKISLVVTSVTGTPRHLSAGVLFENTL